MIKKSQLTQDDAKTLNLLIIKYLNAQSNYAASSMDTNEYILKKQRKARDAAEKELKVFIDAMTVKRKAPSEIYCPSYCNRGHEVETGKPVGHECYVLPPRALKLESAGKVKKAILEIEKALPLRVHRGVK